MSEKETNRRPEASTEDKMQELFRLMDEKAAQGTLVETEEDVSAQKEKVDTTPLSESETAAFEYNMMMMQYEAMLRHYEAAERMARTLGDEDSVRSFADETILFLTDAQDSWEPSITVAGFPASRFIPQSFRDHTGQRINGLFKAVGVK